MVDKDEQIKALLIGRAYDLATKVLGVSDMTKSSYADVFTVTRKEVEDFVRRNGFPSGSFYQREGYYEGLHCIHEEGNRWRVYWLERGVKYDERTFHNEEAVIQELISRCLGRTGTGIYFT